MYEAVCGAAFHWVSQEINHKQQVKQLAQKYREDLPQDADDIGKLFKPRTSVKRSRQQFFDDRDGFERIDDAIGLIRVFEPEGREEGLNHFHPP